MAKMARLNKIAERTQIYSNVDLSRSSARIARATGIPTRTVHRDLTENPELIKLRQKQVEELAQFAYEKATAGLKEESIAPRTATEQATRDAIYIDKFALLTGRVGNTFQVTSDNRQITFNASPEMVKIFKNMKHPSETKSKTLQRP